MATIHWIAGSGNWTTASNWSTDTVPGSSDDAVLDAPGTYTVTVSSDETINSLSGTATATIDITGGTFTVTDFTGDDPLILSGGAFNMGTSTASTCPRQV
jgi:hypothetical protein